MNGYRPTLWSLPDPASPPQDPSSPVSLSPPHSQGQAAVRNQSGSANVMFGYSRPLGPHDTLEGMAVLDVMRPLVTMSATRQIGTHTAATATVCWELRGGEMPRRR